MYFLFVFVIRGNLYFCQMPRVMGPSSSTISSQCTSEVQYIVIFSMNHMESTGTIPLPLSLLRVINVKFPLQPHQKYYITQ